MKIKHLFGLAVIAAMTASCSSNEDLGTAGPGTGNNEAGVGYATFTINLPSTNGSTSGARGTRADKEGTPSFNEGTLNEYAVNDATLLVFQKDGEDYKYIETVDLGSMEPWTKQDPANSGITTTATVTAKLTNAAVGESGNYYALILLNNNVDATKKKVTLPTATTDTYANWSKTADNANADNYLKHDNGFFMANAPKYVADGEPETLVKISHIYASKKQAEISAATTVYVERGLAKVTMKDFTPTGYDIADGTYKEANVKISSWQLDVTNKSTFPVHQTAGLKTSWTGIWANTRFYDGSTTSAFQRVYWGTDPNYNTGLSTVSDCEAAFNMIKNNEVKGEAGETHPQYCLENTFDLNNMKQGQTTRVVFKAVFTPKGFTGTEKTFYKIGNNTALWKEADLETQIKAKAQEVLKESDASKVTVTLNAPTNNLTEAGVHLVAAANVTHVGATTALTEDQVKAINAKLGLKEKTTKEERVGISTYYKGEAYYIARIKHFNELTPWTTGDAYGTKNEKYLGRYGVLRNNWYELSVNKVTGLGYPDVPEVKPTDPDDENEQYINVAVKILSWAKRSDTIDL
ncbi:MAG: Mfa1 family fimbria major subunit [Segatella copri]|nr:Mfa1 family fimbria major subunit [Segatella copri]